MNTRRSLVARQVSGGESTPRAKAARKCDLLELRNLGPTVVNRLAGIGIASRADLALVGAPKAYRWMAEKAAPHRLAVCYYLYSLEGALQGKHWDDFSNDEKAQLRKATGLKL